MKNLKYLLFFIPFLFISCFDIVEKIKLNNDGSGEYSIILNASKSKTRLTSIMKMKTINGKKVPSNAEINSKVTEVSNQIKQISGISDVVTSVDLSQYIVKLNFNFKSVENINSSLETLKAKKLIDSKIPAQLYTYQKEKKLLIKNNQNTFKKEYSKMKAADKEALSNANYTVIMQFQENIKSQTNVSYQVSPNKKALKLNGAILDFINQKKNFQNTVQIN